MPDWIRVGTRLDAARNGVPRVRSAQFVERLLEAVGV